MNDYYLGLDMGTDSVGWAVTDLEYKVPKFKGNAMWGVRLFDESNTAEERRAFRSSRRRLDRRRERLDLLETLFCDEVSKIDKTFFIRLKESNLYAEDKTIAGNCSLFNDDTFSDKDYYKQYPTIYHLRKSLIENDKKHDIRLVFLALHHIIKNRGHFLYDSLGTNDINSFKGIFDDLKIYLNDLSLSFGCDDISEFENTLKDNSLSITAKSLKLQQLCNVSKKNNPQIFEMLRLISGAKVQMAILLDNDELSISEAKAFSFKDGYEENEDKYREIIGEDFELIEKLKALYDWSVLANVLNGEKFISFAKVRIFEKHKSDLALLKKYVKNECTNELYKEIFKENKKDLCNYVAYSGHFKSNGKGESSTENKHINVLAFCEYLKKNLPKSQKPEYSDMFSRIELGTFMPKSVTKDNGIIPMQVHKSELIAILNNSKKYYKFLDVADENGLTVFDKIVSLFEYRIPYYVGPLNRHSKNSWIVRKDGKIYPWNLKSIVDMDATAEAFINNLTSKCTYLPSKDVIAKNSILYSKFSVLNELNNLTVNGEKISVEMKQGIYNNLFLKRNKVSESSLKKYFESNGYKDITIGGIDGDFKSSLKSFRELANYPLSEEEMEKIIKAVTIFGDDRKLLKKRITNNYSSKLNEQQISSICKMKFSGWGNLSKEFLTEIEGVNPATGEVLNIISALWETNDNLMILLGSKYNFAESLQNALPNNTESSMKELVENLYVSPKVKRPIYQSLKITQEIIKAKKSEPKKIFVEMARGPEEKKRTVSRKNKLLDIYKSLKKETPELFSELNLKSDDDLRIDKLFLYFTQMGKCMYTGDSINLDDLLSNNSKYDIDHIFPQSKVKDDSLDNRVLVDKTQNAYKNNDYPIEKNIRTKMYSFWKMLKDKELISDKKFLRLTRNEKLSDAELSDFIERQLVETRQSTKAVAGILKQLYPNTEIVYVKAGLVSDFRKDNDFLKCRDVNDFHHAKDAYLNIVVGNVYNVKFTHNRVVFLKGLQDAKFSLNKMFNYSVKNAWNVENNASIVQVKQQMNKNNILFTRYSFTQSSGLFDQNILKKGNGQVPIKASGAISNIEKYGGYNRPASAFFAFVEYEDKKGKRIKALIPIDLYLVDLYKKEPERYLSEHCGILNAKVLIPCIKYNACISFDGFKMHISSKSSGGAGIVYKPAMQMVLGYNYEKYIRNISKYLEKFTYREINGFDNLTTEENIQLYEQILFKLNNTIFKVKFGSLGKRLNDSIETFKKLPIKEQCYTISELLKIVHCNVLSGDLTKIGEAKKSGITTSNNKLSEISGVTSIKLIDESITGLYKKEKELLH